MNDESSEKPLPPPYVTEYIQRLIHDIEFRTKDLEIMFFYQNQMQQKYRRSKLVRDLCILNNLNRFIDQQHELLQQFEFELYAVQNALPKRFLIVTDKKASKKAAAKLAAKERKMKKTTKDLQHYREQNEKMWVRQRRGRRREVTNAMSPLARSPPPSSSSSSIGEPLARIRSFLCMRL